MGMTPTNLHYCNNKVLVKAYNVLTSMDLPCERLAPLKAIETIKSHLVKVFQFTLLGVSLFRGLMVIQLECYPVKGFTNAC